MFASISFYHEFYLTNFSWFAPETLMYGTCQTIKQIAMKNFLFHQISLLT